LKESQTYADSISGGAIYKGAIAKDYSGYKSGKSKYKYSETALRWVIQYLNAEKLLAE
jgi:hypothetical protein